MERLPLAARHTGIQQELKAVSNVCDVSPQYTGATTALHRPTHNVYATRAYIRANLRLVQRPVLCVHRNGKSVFLGGFYPLGNRKGINSVSQLESLHIDLKGKVQHQRNYGATPRGPCYSP